MEVDPFEAAHEQLSWNSDDSVTSVAGDMQTHMRKLLKPMGAEINKWLASLEGKRIPKKYAQSHIAAILRTIELANRQLYFDGTTVTLLCEEREEKKDGYIRVRTIGHKPQQMLHQSVEFPKLTTRPKQ